MNRSSAVFGQTFGLFQVDLEGGTEVGVMLLVVGEQDLDFMMDEQVQILGADPVEDQEGGQGVVIAEGVVPLEPHPQLQGALGLLVVGDQLIHPLDPGG